MKTKRCLILLAFVAVPFFIPAGGLAEKPRGPIELSFGTDATPSVGAVLRMTLTVTAHVEASELTVLVELPEGLAHVEGELDWSGPVAKDQPVSLEFAVGPLQDRSYEIVGKATAKLRSGATWSQAASTVLEPGGPLPQAEKPSPRLKHGRQGQSILEIPAK
jgi:hypothetical protein